MALYVDPILKKYQELIEAAMPGLFKRVYHGDPILIPRSNMPALIISKTQTRIGVLTNAEDEHSIAIVLTVVVDIFSEMNDDQKITPGISKLYDIIEGRDDATYALKTNTLLDLLRSNVVVDASKNLRTDLNTITRADYGLTVGKREKDAFAVEGQVEFEASFSQVR